MSIINDSNPGKFVDRVKLQASGSNTSVLVPLVVVLVGGVVNRFFSSNILRSTHLTINTSTYLKVLKSLVKNKIKIKWYFHFFYL